MRYETPVDEFSGIPLPLCPVYMSERRSRYAPDDHHPWHDRLSPLLADVGGQALRASRVQRANYDAHHLDYHDGGKAFAGPKLPETDEQRLRPIILATAGYVPDRAIAFDGDHDPYLTRLTKEQRVRLWTSHQIRVDQPSKVRAFLFSYVFRQGSVISNEAMIEEFLETSNDQRRHELGNVLIGRGTRDAIKAIEPVYSAAYKQELIPHREKQVARFVLDSMGMWRSRPTVDRALKYHLSALVA